MKKNSNCLNISNDFKYDESKRGSRRNIKALACGRGTNKNNKRRSLIRLSGIGAYRPKSKNKRIQGKVRALHNPITRNCRSGTRQLQRTSRRNESPNEKKHIQSKPSIRRGNEKMGNGTIWKQTLERLPKSRRLDKKTKGNIQRPKTQMQQSVRMGRQKGSVNRITIKISLTRTCEDCKITRTRDIINSPKFKKTLCTKCYSKLKQRELSARR